MLMSFFVFACLLAAFVCFAALRVAVCGVFAARACFCLFLSVAGVVGVEASFFLNNLLEDMVKRNKHKPGFEIA